VAGAGVTVLVDLVVLATGRDVADCLIGAKAESLAFSSHYESYMGQYGN